MNGLKLQAELIIAEEQAGFRKGRRRTNLYLRNLCEKYQKYQQKLYQVNRLVGLVVKASASRAEDPGFESRDFFGVESYQWLLQWLPCQAPWRHRVSIGTGWPSVSILWLGEMESSVCNVYLSVAARKIVWADPSLRYTCMLLGR